MGIIAYIKPSSMYNKDTNTYKPFGSGPNATLFPMWLCAFVVAVGSYVLVDSYVQWKDNKTIDSTTSTQSYTTDHPDLTTTTQQQDVLRDHPPTHAMLVPPMRRATFGGTANTSFDARHQAFASAPSIGVSHGYHPPSAYTHASTVSHEPHCALHKSSPYSRTHPSKHKMHVHNSRVWKNVM